MTHSRFVSLTPYCLVEYMFEPLGSTNFLNDDFALLKNETTGAYQILNNDGSFSTTKNIQDLTVVQIGNNKVAYLDSEKVPNYIDYDSNITKTPVTGFNVIFDKVRFHFVAGFNFEGFESLILSIRNKQNDGENHVFANILVAPETIGSLITFNSKPLFLSDATYDRYIDIKIPSIKNINEDYRNAANKATTFVAAITPSDTGSVGFIYNSQISINLSECARREKLATNTNTKYDVFEISNNFEASLSQSNEFDGVGANIYESSNGDFIEYYLTFNSGFPEELISILNKRNPSDDWIIIHQLSVFEQVGSSFINTSRQISFQEDGYDEPLVFRPVLKNAGSAVSMSIDLLCRLTNKRNGEQIIREASFTLISPKKYGKKLITIPLTDEPQSQKVYNKIIKKNFESTNLFIEPTFAPGFEQGSPILNARPVSSVEYVPVFFSNNNISIANNSGLVKISDKDDEIIFGPGKLKFVLSPFDNAIKIKLYNVINKKPIPLDLNLSSAKYRMVFDLDSGKVKVDNDNSDKTENLSNGELVFKVSKNDSENIFASSKQTVYITSVSQDGIETLMYTGEWRRPTQQSDIDAAISVARGEAEEKENREAKIAELENKVNQLTLDANKKKFDILSSNVVKQKAVPAIVNKFAVANPKLIKTNVSNAGSKSIAIKAADVTANNISISSAASAVRGRG